MNSRVTLPFLIPYSDWYFYLSSGCLIFSLSLLCRTRQTYSLSKMVQ
ncbi:hypothetical protein [Escherichia phage vB_EcoM_LMP25]|uniref:Uncharacterized protein n=1 Tax=Escherichia phage vB_EcoM_LMP25 TaxID=2491663 RepID=A0A482MSZ6_9CAUD|nr:hypothetical protein [Escherichia phage vB_EcoM_LMP34]QBQ76256.1 hypothetical protein [Escherichia phage vB_EcoM_LMP33]QBQ76413.1 hypothetical protein [Escherichia phage vB_EcoM_LMP25]